MPVDLATAAQALLSALPPLLQAYWVLCSAAAALALIPLPALAWFRSAVILSACRGKIIDFKPPNALGPFSDWTVPQKWFWHFYAIGATWNPVLIYVTAQHSNGSPSIQAALCALSLFEVHLVRRLLETLFLMHYPAHARMHGIAYLYGLSYYVVVPATIAPVLFTQWLLTSSWKDWAATARVIPAQLAGGFGNFTLLQCLGVAVFLAGNVLQLQSHVLLSRLGGQRRGTTYFIPRGGGFELVSCPHYLAEITIYCGLAMIAGPSRPLVLLIVVWVLLNLMLAAGMTQQWYHKKFSTYPKTRRALIPWVY